MENIVEQVKNLKRDLGKTPWHIKLIVLLGIGYLLSPIDLIPDFIPVIGQLDDLILLAGLVKLVRKYSK